MFLTTATTLLALFAVGVLAADEPLTAAQSGVAVPFKTSCVLKVVGTSSNVYNGDVSFFKGNQELVLFGLHPEWNGGSLAVKNNIFKQGKKQWGYQWVSVSYPSGGGGEREYTFEFKATELAILSQGEALISIKYNELTPDPEGFLNDLDIVKFKPGTGDLKFAQICSVGTERKTLPKLIIYDHADQGGTAVTLIGPSPRFDLLKFNDKIGSVWAVTGDWELYTGYEYLYSRFFVKEGEKINARDSNAYSSARPANCRYISDPTTAKLRVSTSSHLQYGTTEYLTPQKDLGDMANKITSVIADKGDWEMYQYTGYEGSRLVIQEGDQIEHTGDKGFDNIISSLRPICETYNGKEKCALSRIEVLDSEGDLSPRYTGTEIIGSQSSGSCYGPAEHEIEIVQINAVEESVSLELSKENEVNWDITVSASVEVSVGFMGSGSSFSAGLSLGVGGAVTMGSSKTTETTTANGKEHGQVTQFAVPGAGIVFGIVDRYEVDQSDIPVIMHMTCPDGVNKTVDSSIAMKKVSFGAAHFWSLTGQFTKAACRANRNIPDCVENVRKNFANFIGQKDEIEDAFEACFSDGKGEFRRMKRKKRRMKRRMKQV